MKKNMIMITALLIGFIGIVVLLNIKFQEDVKKNEEKIAKLEKKNSSKKETYKESYEQLIQQESGKGVAIEEEIRQYLSVDEDSYENVDFILTSSGNLYIGFPNYDGVLPEELTNTLEPFEFLNRITLEKGEDQFHTFIGKKILENIDSLYHVKVKENQKTIFVYITKDKTIGKIDITNVSEGVIETEEFWNYKNIVSILQSKNQNEFEVYALSSTNEQFNISEDLVKS